jgi:hypothetical protein
MNRSIFAGRERFSGIKRKGFLERTVPKKLNKLPNTISNVKKKKGSISTKGKS